MVFFKSCSFKYSRHTSMKFNIWCMNINRFLYRYINYHIQSFFTLHISFESTWVKFTSLNEAGAILLMSNSRDVKNLNLIKIGDASMWILNIFSFSDGRIVVPEHASTFLDVAFGLEYVGGNWNAARHNG